MHGWQRKQRRLWLEKCRSQTFSPPRVRFLGFNRAKMRALQGEVEKTWGLNPQSMKGPHRAAGAWPGRDAETGSVRDDLDVLVETGLDLEFARIDSAVMPRHDGIVALRQDHGGKGADRFPDDVA